MSWTLLDSGVAAFADGNAGHVYSFPAGAASAGDLLVLAVSSDTVMSTPSGWSVAVSDVHNIGAYLFYKAAVGSETSITLTTSGDFATEIGFLRYSGAASVPLDVTAAAFNTVNNNTTPAATTGTLASTGELAVAAACLGGMGGGTPNTPTWSTGYTNHLDGQTAGTSGADQHLFVADRRDAGTAAESPSCTWSSNTNNQTLLVSVFKPAGGQTVTLGQAIETDTARPVVVNKARTIGQAFEADSAQPVAATKTRHLRQAAETDTGQRITLAKARRIGQAIETDTAQPLTVTGGAAPTDATISTIKGGNPHRGWSVASPARAWSADAPRT